MKKLSDSEIARLSPKEREYYNAWRMAEYDRQKAEEKAAASAAAATTLAQGFGGTLIEREAEREASPFEHFDRAHGIAIDPATGALGAPRMVRVVEDRGASQVFGVLRPAKKA